MSVGKSLLFIRVDDETLQMIRCSATIRRIYQLDLKTDTKISVVKGLRDRINEGIGLLIDDDACATSSDDGAAKRHRNSSANREMGGDVPKEMRM